MRPTLGVAAVRLEAAEIAELAIDVASHRDPDRARDQIIRRAQWIFGTDGVTMMMVRRGGQEFVAASPKDVGRADELQLSTREGPCLSAARDGQMYISVDTRTDPRWPTWGPKVAELGWQSSLSAPLQSGSQSLGALNLYSRTLIRCDQEFLDAVDVFTAQAATILHLVTQTVDLQRAIDSRHFIGQAQGILMQLHGIDAEQAFRLLKEHSQRHNIKLRAVAAIVIDTRRMPDPQHPPRPDLQPT